MAEQDQTEKTHEPTPKKLEDARKKGDVPKSQDLATVASYFGLLIAAWMAGTASVAGFATYGSSILGQSDRLSEAFFASTGAAGKPVELYTTPIRHLISWFAFPLVFVLLAYVAQRAIVFAPDKIIPKLNRISILEGFKNKFGLDGIFNFTKSTVKLLIISVTLGVYILRKLPDIISSLALSPGSVVRQMGLLCLQFLMVTTVIMAAIAVVDTLWQFASYQRRNKMSDRDLRDESKDSDGDPHLKQERRQRGQAIATQQMMSDVPLATVVVVNPTHISVALKWSREDLTAPVCVAKGKDAVALKIREVARDSAVPIHSDPPTARALFATVEVGEAIDPEFYAPVAAAIRFAEAVKKKGRGL